MCFAMQLCVQSAWTHEDYEKWRLCSVNHLRSLSDTYTARSGSPPPSFLHIPPPPNTPSHSTPIPPTSGSIQPRYLITNTVYLPMLVFVFFSYNVCSTCIYIRSVFKVILCNWNDIRVVDILKGSHSELPTEPPKQLIIPLLKHLLNVKVASQMRLMHTHVVLMF